MAPLAAPSINEVWLTFAEARELGANERTLQRHNAAGRIEVRKRNGINEVRLTSLDHRIQLAWAEREAQVTSSVQARIEQDLSSSEAVRRLKPYGVELGAAMKRECARRALLLIRLEYLPKSTVVDGKRTASKAVLDLLEEWPCRDPLVLASRPTWAEPCSERTLRRQRERMKFEGGAASLIPGRSHVTRADDRRLRPLLPAVEADVRHFWLHLYPNATVTSVHRKLVAKYADDAPSRTRFRKLVSQIPRGAHVMARKGEKTYRATAAPPILRTFVDLDVYEVLNGDHHQFDLFVRNPNRGQQLDRPWLTGWLDLRSRAICGWDINFQPNSRTIMAALCHAIAPKKDPAFANLCGRPSSVYIDNGKDYRSKFLEGDGQEVLGNLAMLGISTTHAIAYNAKAKPIERAFLTLCQQFSKDQPTYIGNNPAARTERVRELVKQHEAWLEKRASSTPFMTLDELKVKFAEWVVEYLRREHEGLREQEGRAIAPAGVALLRREAPRIPPDAELAFIAWPVWKRTVKKSHVSIDGVSYTNDDLWKYDGEQIEVRRDPVDVSRVFLRTNDPRPGDDFILGMARSVELARHGKVDERAFIEGKKRQRETERKVREYIDAAAGPRDLEGFVTQAAADLAPVVEPPSPASPAATPADTVIDFAPARARLARELATAQAEAEDFGPAVELPAAPAPDFDAEDEAAVLAYLGERPNPAGISSLIPGARAIEEQNLAEWEADYARLIALRRQRRLETRSTPEAPHARAGQSTE